MIVPPWIKKGDRIRMVAPAGKVTPDEINSAFNALGDLGFEVIYGMNVFKEYFQFSASDKERLADLQEAFDDPKTAAIFCVRGGYGTVRLLPYLGTHTLLEHPKWLTGFSDITVLHCLFNNLGIASLHGVMPKLFFTEPANRTESLDSLFRILYGSKADYVVAGHPLNKSGNASGELVGGNLSVLYGLQRTPEELKTENKILFLEDIGENLYHIDRMFQNLRLSGMLSKLKGLIIGDFSDLKDSSETFGQAVEQIVCEVVSDYSFPVCFGFPAGHEPLNLALAFGMNWELSVQEDTSILKMN